MATKNELKEIKSNMATKKDLGKIEDKLDGITRQVVGNSELIAKLSNSLDRQERILQTLALRSIEQESELRAKKI